MVFQSTCVRCRSTWRFARLTAGATPTCTKCQTALPTPTPIPVALPATPFSLPLPPAAPSSDSELDFRETPAARRERLPARGPSAALVWGSVGVALVVGLAVTVAVVVAGRTPAPVADAPQGPPSAAPAAVAPLPPLVPPAKLTREQVYEKVLPSVAFILGEGKTRQGSFTSCGSGCLIHAGRRLVLTNHHVVEGNDTLVVFFPDFAPTKGLVTDPKNYVDRIRSLGLPGKVVASDPKLDLALIELPRLPKSAEPLTLAATPAATGSSVLSVGASGVNLQDFSGTLWRLSSGDVRGRYERKMEYDNGQQVRAMVLETQKPSNPGDSGGPTVNEDGELVAVVSSGSRVQNAVANDIDLTEVRAFLKAHAAKGGWQWVDTTAAPPAKGPRPSRADRVAALVAALKSQKGAELVATLRQLTAHGPDARAAIPDLIRLLDDPTEAVRSAAKAALEAVGDPGTAEEWAVTAALAGPAPHARRYALALLAGGRPPTREQVTLLITAASAGGEPDDRARALRALGKVATDAKPDVAPLLLALLGDESPAVVEAAEAALVALMPYPAALTETFAASLAAPAPRRRRVAVRALAPLTESARQAGGWFVPCLRDADPEVRVMALEALARWEGDGGRVIAAAPVIGCLNATDPAVRTAAVRAVGRLGLSAAIPHLLPLLGESGSGGLKAPATDALLALEPATAEAADDLFRELFKQAPLASPERTLRKLAASNRPVGEYLPAVAPYLRDRREPVRAAALAVMSAGRAGAEAWAADIAGVIAGSDAEGEAAVACLKNLGKVGATHLAAALRSDTPAATRLRVYAALGELAAVAPPECCDRLVGEAERFPRDGYTIARAVAAFDPAVALPKLREVAYSENAGRKLERKSVYPTEFQIWALETVGLLDVRRLDPPEQAKLRDWLFSKKHYDGDRLCRDAAAKSLAAVERKLAKETQKK